MSGDSDPFYNWRLRAAAATSRLGYPPDLVNEAAGILSVALGREWLTSASQWEDRSLFQLRRHPLARALNSRGDPEIIEVLELAEYLKSAAHLEGFADAVSGIKSQYYQTLLPLAFAHRVALLGTAALSLEPPAAGGRLADIAMEWSGEPYLIECYRPTIVGQPEHHVGRLLMGVLRHFSADEQTIAVAIQLQGGLDHQKRKSIVRSVADAKRVLSDGGFREAVLVRHDHALISVAPTVAAAAGQHSALALHPDFPRLPNETSQFARLAIGDRAALNVVNTTQANPTHSCVAVWEQDAATGGDRLPDVDSAFERVVKKVKRKLTQTRSGQSRRRLVVVDTWTTGHLDQLDVDPDVYVRGRVLGDRAATAILFTRRYWDRDASRYRYRLQVFAQEDDAQATALVEALNDREEETTVPG